MKKKIKNLFFHRPTCWSIPEGNTMFTNAQDNTDPDAYASGSVVQAQKKVPEIHSSDKKQHSTHLLYRSTEQTMFELIHNYKLYAMECCA